MVNHPSSSFPHDGEFDVKGNDSKFMLKADTKFLPKNNLRESEGRYEDIENTSFSSAESKAYTDNIYSNESLYISKNTIDNFENVLKTDIPVVEKLVNAGNEFLFCIEFYICIICRKIVFSLAR